MRIDIVTPFRTSTLPQPSDLSGSVEIVIPHELILQVGEEGAALLWVESLRRTHLPVTIELPDLSQTTDAASLGFIYALLAATSSSFSSEAQRNAHESLAAKIHVSKEILRGPRSAFLLSREPMRLLPRAMRAAIRPRTLGYTAVNNVLRHEIAYIQGTTQPVLASDYALEFLFQALSNAIDEERLLVEEMQEGDRRGIFGVLLRRFAAGSSFSALLPPDLHEWADATSVRGAELMSFTVCDLGRGIIQSLSNHPMLQHIEPVEQLAAAFSDKVSSKASLSRAVVGGGLRKVHQAADYLRGCLVLQSGGHAVKSEYSSPQESELPTFISSPERISATFGTSITLMWQESQ